MIGKSLLMASIVAVAAFAGVPQIQHNENGQVSVRYGAAPAQAGPRHREARRVARRTSRRTTRRTVRRLTVLPAGCAWRAPYHYCGGVYYQPVVEGGTTVYVVVTP